MQRCAASRGHTLHNFDGSVVVAVIAVGMVQRALDQIIDMIAVRDRLMTTAETVHVVCFISLMLELWRAAIGVLGAHLEHMLLDNVAILMVQVAVVKVVDVIAMPDCGVAAAGTVPMWMVGMSLCHDGFLSFLVALVCASSQACSIALSMRFRTCVSAIE
jgi:hypothetical protein